MPIRHKPSFLDHDSKSGYSRTMQPADNPTQHKAAKAHQSAQPDDVGAQPAKTELQPGVASEEHVARVHFDGKSKGVPHDAGVRHKEEAGYGIPQRRSEYTGDQPARHRDAVIRVGTGHI